VALIHAKISLLELLGEDPGGANVVLFGNAPVQGLFPRRFASAIIDVAAQRNCLVCAPYRHAPAAI
jgi:hypothetical protein